MKKTHALALEIKRWLSRNSFNQSVIVSQSGGIYIDGPIPSGYSTMREFIKQATEGNLFIVK